MRSEMNIDAREVGSMVEPEGFGAISIMQTYKRLCDRFEKRTGDIVSIIPDGIMGRTHHSTMRKNINVPQLHHTYTRYAKRAAGTEQGHSPRSARAIPCAAMLCRESQNLR